jgi:hypothetical protein
LNGPFTPHWEKTLGGHIICRRTEEGSSACENLIRLLRLPYVLTLQLMTLRPQALTILLTFTPYAYAPYAYQTGLYIAAHVSSYLES